MKYILPIIIIYIRYLLGGTLVFASIIKIKGLRFTSESGADYDIDSAWHLFETLYQSGLYWKFIGVMQLLAGFLLLTQRFAKLGALVSLPIITNIFVITISYYFAYTPVITGLMLLSSLVLLIWDWDSLKILLNFKINIERVEHKKSLVRNEFLWEIVGLIIFLFTAIYRILYDSYNFIFWLGVCVLIGFSGLILSALKPKVFSRKN